MLCKFCGMDSATTDVCSWCGKPLGAAQAADTAPPDSQTAVPLPSDTPPAAPLLVEDAEAASLVSPDTAAQAAPSLNRRVAPAMPAMGRLRGPAPAVPPLSARAPSSTPATSGGIGSVSPSAAPPAAAPFAGSLAGADLNAAADSPAGETYPPSAAPLQAAPLSSAPLPTASAEATTLIGSVASLTPPTAPASPALLNAPVQGEGIGTAAGGTEDIRAGRDAGSRPLNARPAVDMTGDVAIGTVAAPQRTIDDAPALEPKPTMDAAQRKAAVDAALADGGPTPMELLTRYAGVFALILLGVGVLSFALKSFYILPMVLAMFAGGMLLPIMHVTPWADEDSDDLVWFVLLTLLFGPVVSLIIFGMVALVRQEFNPSILGCFIVAGLVRIVAELASGGVGIHHLISATSPFGSLGHIDAHLVEMLLLNWAGFAALAGWYAASSFHKEDE